MAALVISISSDVSVKSVGSSFLRVILIGSISVEVLVAPEVGAAVVASLIGVLEFDTHSSSEADPSESSPPPVSIAPMVSPFLCLDDSESNTKIPKRHVSPTTSTPEIHTAPIFPAPSAIVAPSSEFSLARVVLTTRKLVRPLPSHRLALRYTSHHLDRFTSGSSSSHSSSDHSLSGHSSSDHSLSEHTPPDTTDADSSTTQRFVHLMPSRTPQCSKAYLRWRSSPLSTIVTSSIHSTRALVPSRADLLPPHKRFRDSISPKDNVEDDINTDVLEDIEADATPVKVAVYRDVKAEIDVCIGMEVDVRTDVENEVKDEVESSDRGTIEIGVDMDARIDILNCMLMPEAVECLEQVEEVDSYRREKERAGLSDRTRSLERENLKVQALLIIERDRVDSLCRHMALSLEEFRQKTIAKNGSDDNNGNRRNGNDRNRNGKNRIGKDGNVGNGNPNENNRDARPVVRECCIRHIMERAQKLMAEVFYPRNEDQKMESELWNLTVKNNDLAAYTQRFQELTMFYTKMRVNRGQQPPFKRPNVRGQSVAKAYTVGNNERRPYNRLFPLCNKCKLHHEGPCTVRCEMCNKVGHLTRDWKVTISTTSTQKARGKAYVLGRGDANPDSSVVKGTFLLNNHYAFVLFNSGADRSFVSSTFSTLLDIIPDTLGVSYAVELADERIYKTNTMLRGCTLGLLGHPFNVDLMPVELGSFDVIIGIDWLANHHAVIICDEKIVRIPYGDEVLIVQGDEGEKGEKSKLSIISCTKTQKYIKIGCPIFMAQLLKTETVQKSEEKRLEDVPTVRDFLEVFPEDFPELPFDATS
uniref:Reverse transcriptase domain-containing protein n=1 Tax=Tanacetum cinerariifolium TaxID=118510 RepID=A0A6L2KPD3_TANCI|nr:reverse transcriptase domain-containing protein [Tanacetum cinerariifolium]